MSIRQNIVTGAGETFILNLNYNDAAGDPVDLTGHEVALVVEKSRVGTAVGSYAGTVDALGRIEFKVSDEVTATWPVGKLAYRVEHENPTGDVRWLVYGALTVIDGNDV